MADGSQTTAEPISDSDRLIAVLQACFTELSQKQDERTERLHRAVEALRPQAPATDKKTAFWNSYMKLADEHDKEFQQKYSTDLDTALIFAGLFSAVSSAFIIQIQPLLPSPAPIIMVAVLSLLYISLFTTLLAALLAVLGKQWVMYYQAAGSRGTIEQRGLERQRKLDGLRKWKFDAILQVFPLLLQLALLLFSSALSLYLWTVHHAIAAIVLALTLLGAGCYVFLLASAVLSPDSPFQTPLAPPLVSMMSETGHILDLTGRRLRSYWRPVGSSLTSFFQSKSYILPSFSVSPPPRSRPEVIPNEYFTQPSVEVPAVVWALETSTDPIVVSAAAEMAIGLQWPLDLDFKLLMDRLAEGFRTCVDVDGRFFGAVTLRKGMGKHAINCGMAFGSLRHTALASSRYDWWDFYLNVGWPHVSWPQHTLNVNSEIVSLSTVQGILHGDFSIQDASDPALIRWQLDVIPTLHRDKPIETILGHILQGLEIAKIPSFDGATFTTYLCCVISLCGPVEPRILAEVDKSRLKYRLLAQLFEVLQNIMTSHTSLVARVIDTTAKLANKSANNNRSLSHEEFRDLMTEISRFCVTFPSRPESLQLFVSAAMLAKLNAGFLQSMEFALTQSVEWVCSALQHLQQLSDENSSECGDDEKWDSMTGSLLQFLAFTDASKLPDQPPSEVFSTILRALSAPSSASLPAFLVLSRAKKWLLDPNLQPLVDKSAVWSQLGRVALEYPMVKARYYELGQYLADTPEWKSAIYHHLLTWITTFTTTMGTSGLKVFISVTRTFTSLPHDRRGWVEFISVTRTVWLPALDGQEELNDEIEIWSVVTKALAKAWGIFNSSPTLRDCFSLARCTINSSFDNWIYIPIPPDIRSLVSPQLGTSVLQVAANIRHANLIPEVGAQAQSTETRTGTGTDEPCDARPASERLADFLDELGQKLSTEFAPTPGSEVRLGGVVRQYHDRAGLRDHFMDELIAMEQLLGLSADEIG